MPADDLHWLYKLHLIDKAIVEIRARAGALDPGRALQASIAKLEAEFAEIDARSHALHAELTDLELRTKGIDEKLKKIDGELYGGKVVNPREIENLEKEVVALKKQRSELDERTLQLWDAYPPAKEASDEAHKRVEEKRTELKAYQEKVRQAQAQLQEAFTKRSAERGIAAEKVDKALLARYEAIRQKNGGIGMTNVSKEGSCEMCGTMLPVKSIETAKEGRVAMCEGCHRILHVSEGLV